MCNGISRIGKCVSLFCVCFFIKNTSGLHLKYHESYELSLSQSETNERTQITQGLEQIIKLFFAVIIECFALTNLASVSFLWFSFCKKIHTGRNMVQNSVPLSSRTSKQQWNTFPNTRNSIAHLSLDFSVDFSHCWRPFSRVRRMVRTLWLELGCQEMAGG